MNNLNLNRKLNKKLIVVLGDTGKNFIFPAQ